jgi:methylmalonyl-CoA mutase
MSGATRTFAPLGEERWRRLVAKAIKDAPFETLVGRTDDGLPVGPLYQRTRGPRAGRAKGPWRVMARLDHPDPQVANGLALEDLAGGADGLEIVVAGASDAHGYGLGRGDPATLDLVLKDVAFETARIEFDPGPLGEKVARSLAERVARACEPAKADVGFGLDPIGALALSGRGQAWSIESEGVANFARDMAAQGFTAPFLAADARLVHAAGGSPAQELVFALVTALTYLRALEGAGMTLDAARRAIGFRLAADADEFVSLAKFRALRLLWARIEEACGLEASSARLHGASAWRMMTARDAYVNILRIAMAAFSAGLGGADSFTALPFTQPIGLPDSFARRLARNTQLVLLEESHLGFVADPAAGAGGFEALTQALCAKAWDLLQKIEAKGGIVAALTSGEFQAEVAKVAEARSHAIARREAPITGLSDFPDLAEIAPDVLLCARPAFAYEGAPLATPLVAHRLAEPFEALRDASDARLRARGERPKIFLANLGPVAAFNARATFAKSLFEAGGVEAIGNDGFPGGAEAAVAFMASGARLACLCSSDAVYLSMTEPAARALRQAGARVWMAARPGEREAAWRAAGVENFVFAGCDALAALREAHRQAE